MTKESELLNCEARKTILTMEKENIELKHKYKMEELLTERENTKLFHERELERLRIRRAEDRKMLLEKMNYSHALKGGVSN